MAVLKLSQVLIVSFLFLVFFGLYTLLPYGFFGFGSEVYPRLIKISDLRNHEECKPVTENEVINCKKCTIVKKRDFGCMHHTEEIALTIATYRKKESKADSIKGKIAANQENYANESMM